MNDDLVQKLKNCKGIFYFHTMKTGGTYMRKNLEKLCDLAGIDLICSSRESGFLSCEREHIPEGYIKIATVREPLEMFNSYFHFMRFDGELRTTGGIGDRWWMCGTRTPLTTISEFLDYYTSYGDFAHMMQNPQDIWSYTFEPGYYCSSPRTSRKEDDKQFNILTILAAIRPPQQLRRISELIVKASENYRWMNFKDTCVNPTGDKIVQDSYSYSWAVPPVGETEDRELHIVKWFHNTSVPFPKEYITRFFETTPESGIHARAIYSGWEGWIPVCLDAELYDIAQYEFSLPLPLSSPDPCQISALDCWEYILSPFYRLFGFSDDALGECCFDIIIKQENLTEAFDALKSCMGVEFDSSRKVKVTKNKNPVAEVLSKDEISRYTKYFERERKLFGYDDPSSEVLIDGSNIPNFFQYNVTKKLIFDAGFVKTRAGRPGYCWYPTTNNSTTE